jgi:hypothetical protein
MGLCACEVFARATRARTDIAHVEAVEAGVLAELVLADRRRHRCTGARAHRIRSDSRRAFGVAQVVDEIFEYLALARRLRKRRDKSLRECTHRKVGDPIGKTLGLAPMECRANRDDDRKPLCRRSFSETREADVFEQRGRRRECLCSPMKYAAGGARGAHSTAHLTGSGNGSSEKHNKHNNQQKQTYAAANIHFWTPSGCPRSQRKRSA